MERYSCLNKCDWYPFQKTMDYEFETSFFSTLNVIVTHRVQSHLVLNFVFYYALVFLFVFLFIFLYIFFDIWYGLGQCYFHLVFFNVYSPKKEKTEITNEKTVLLFFRFDIVILFIREFPSVAASIYIMYRVPSAERVFWYDHDIWTMFQSLMLIPWIEWDSIEILSKNIRTTISSNGWPHFFFSKLMRLLHQICWASVTWVLSML